MILLLKKKNVAWLSVASNTFLTSMKLIAGVMTGSVSILSEAIHSAIDLLAAVITTFSVHVSDLPPDKTHPYGHEKIENISGVVEGCLILVAAVWIIYESVDKLMHGVDLKYLGPGILVMAVSAGLNVIVATLLKRSSIKNRSIALEADAAHLYTDVYTSLGVFAGLFIITIVQRVWKLSIAWLDPVIAIGVALLILSTAFKITKKSFLPLMDSSASGDEVIQINSIMDKFRDRDIDFHNLRTRHAGGTLHVDLHMGFRQGISLEQGHAISHELKAKIEGALPGAKVLIHVEASGHVVESHEDDKKRIRKLVVEYQGLFASIHELEVISSGGIHHIRLALGVPSALPVSEAHRITLHIEADVKVLFPEGADIDIHLEPCNEDCMSCSAICESRAV